MDPLTVSLAIEEGFFALMLGAGTFLPIWVLAKFVWW